MDSLILEGNKYKMLKTELLSQHKIFLNFSSLENIKQEYINP